MIKVFVIFFLSLVIHELGHLLAALAFRVRVSKLCLFLDPGFRLIDTRGRWGVRLCVGWIPIGAYVKFATEEDEVVPEGNTGKRQRNLFCQLHPMKRLIICLSGAAMNFAFAYVCLFSWTSNYVDSSAQLSTASHIRLTNHIVKCETTKYISSFSDYLASHDTDKDATVKEKSKTESSRRRHSQHSFWVLLWKFGQLNLWIAVFNLLPFPPLDGAQGLYNLYEMLFRKPVNKMVLIIGNLAGLLLILTANAIDGIRFLTDFLS